MSDTAMRLDDAAARDARAMRGVESDMDAVSVADDAGLSESFDALFRAWRGVDEAVRQVAPLIDYGDTYD